ncbi:MAG: ArsC family reductase [Sphingobium sp.]|nr:ArsC family reductase [Sphingobium sp.]
MAVTMYGIPNCDTVKKARSWLTERGVDYAFHDYKKSGIDADRLAEWVDRFGWEKVLNRAGTTFKKLPDAMKADLDAAKAIAIMMENPSAIKRPIVEQDGGALLGFSPAEWEKAF